MIWAPGFSSGGYYVLLLEQGDKKKPKQRDRREKYCLPIHSFKCVTSKQNNLGITQVVSTVKKPNLVLVNMSRYAEAIADVI